MTSLITRRLLSAVVLMFLASAFCFSLVIAAPGNVAVLIAEQRSGTVTKEAVAAVEAELGLGDPFPLRYVRWLGAAVQGDLGPSLRSGEDIVKGFSKRLPQTASCLPEQASSPSSSASGLASWELYARVALQTARREPSACSASPCQPSSSASC